MVGEQGWCSQSWAFGTHAGLPLMWTEFDSESRRHIWVEFVVGSRPCSERFFSGYSGFPLSSKTNISKYQFDPECTTTVVTSSRAHWCFVDTQITFTFFLHSDIDICNHYYFIYLFVYSSRERKTSPTIIHSYTALKNTHFWVDLNRAAREKQTQNTEKDLYKSFKYIWQMFSYRQYGMYQSGILYGPGWSTSYQPQWTVPPQLILLMLLLNLFLHWLPYSLGQNTPSLPPSGVCARWSRTAPAQTRLLVPWCRRACRVLCSRVQAWTWRGSESGSQLRWWTDICNPFYRVPSEKWRSLCHWG